MTLMQMQNFGLLMLMTSVNAIQTAGRHVVLSF
jgi:hypothetical protein